MSVLHDDLDVGRGQVEDDARALCHLPMLILTENVEIQPSFNCMSAVWISLGTPAPQVMCHAGALCFLVSFMNGDFGFHDTLSFSWAKGRKSIVLSWIRICSW